MDPQAVTMMNDGGGAYNFAEIWPAFQMNAAATTSYGLGLDPMNEGDSKRLKANKSNDNLENKVEGEGNSGKAADQSAKPSEPSKQDYIHVRARRGQATDSHSLAERVIGKALVLDEIINYIQSLQRQVEFLSMKLEAVNTKPGIEGYPSKDYAQQTFDASSMAFGSQSAREYVRGLSPEWLHMQIGGGFERTS
ncbi:hypothetical protein BUALT_Bualt17G0056500 [Buddleja alternifolia]|uniref:Uncharacterized protein n=1 Tax=Buddleja alternifolia TaxID=168488 RepID=A0AAV6W716_9LAMI|nr:hypothetical protein BUALT_Bualt17G0056500 [Buddleja alternifolia]